MTSMERISGAEFVKSLAAVHTENNPQLEGDYFDEDGLLRCGTCRQLKRSRIEVSGEEIIVPVWCECRKKAAEVEKKQTAAALAASRQWELRKLSLMDSALSEVRFSAADERENSASIGMCRRYSDLFPQMMRENRGLLLFGNVGTGKTFAAACIANALLEQGVPVVMDSRASKSDVDELKEKIEHADDKYASKAELRELKKSIEKIESSIDYLRENTVRNAEFIRTMTRLESKIDDLKRE